MRRIVLVMLVLALVSVAVLTGCAKKPNPIVTIEIEAGGVIEVELYPKVAPETVNNFVTLVQQGFYDGLVFHRIIPGFMIQGGDPQGNGVGGPGYSIKGEFSANNFRNKLAHSRGVISMARSSLGYNTAGSQFFIMVADIPQLDGQYAAFGKVISGMDVVDRIVMAPSDQAQNGLALEPREVMKKVTVETFGVNYKAPNKITR